MGVRVLFQRLCHVEIGRLVLVMGLIVVTAILVQFYAIPYTKTLSVSNLAEHSIAISVGNAVVSNHSNHDLMSGNEKRDLNDSLQIDEGENTQIGFATKKGVTINDRSVDSSSGNRPVREDDKDLEKGRVEEVDGRAGSRTSSSFSSPRISSLSDVQRTMESQLKDRNAELLQIGSVELNVNSRTPSILVMKKRGVKTTSISRMNSLLLRSHDSSRSRKQRWVSAPERELLSAKLEIENAPIVRNNPGLYASVFRNVSVFRRSYELMEQVLKVYVYKEGDKPIFHQPQLRGIYASEGWFMKLLEENKQFVVRDPRKAHLFYLPFSSRMLRTVLYERNSSSWNDLEKYLTNYVDFIAEKYPFWNRTGGANHFLVACHDWASRITKRRLKNCIRALCNANVAKDFTIGKDTTLPVTYIRKSEDPMRDLGGKSPSARPILAFFAGSMHGYLRPILLQYWGNKESDMKIFDSMPRNTKGKQSYREHMKSSKYCICPRGYEVHTPRVIEAISYECVPVIISDNYVPPLFEVLNWEAFSVFVQEKDVPNLRNILLSIPEKKYLTMQMRVKMVQKHFLWHEKPEKYDIFHMILHSIWYNRIFR